MYTPQNFAETNKEKLHEIIEQHSFSTLVSNEGAPPVASHLPLLLDRNEGPNGKLIGHMARANPQWQQAADQPVLAIFHGPHAYISPTWYEAVNVVPTWNYVAVHAYGILRLETDRDRLLEILQKYVDFYESNMPQPWSMKGVETSFIDNLLDAIVGFEIIIDKIEGKAKLSQNQEEPRQEKVIQALRATTACNNQQIADLMSQRLVR